MCSQRGEPEYLCPILVPHTSFFIIVPLLQKKDPQSDVLPLIYLLSCLALLSQDAPAILENKWVTQNKKFSLLLLGGKRKKCIAEQRLNKKCKFYV